MGFHSVTAASNQSWSFLNLRSVFLQQWASLYQPLTFYADSHLDTPGESLLNKLDPEKAFRGKTKPPAPKKKQTTQPQSGGGPAKGRGSKAGKA